MTKPTMTQTPQEETTGDHFQARVDGQVQHRVGDGQLEFIPVGVTVSVVPAIATMVVSWVEDGQPQNSVLAKDEFERYEESGALVRV